MLRLSKQRYVEPISFNMTPMIDIVFLLIIFFMTVSQLNQNVLPPMKLPVSAAGDDRSLPAEIVLNLTDTGQLNANNVTIERDELDDFLKQEKLRLASDKVSDKKMPRVRLRCDANCSTTHVNLVFERLSALEFEAVVVAVKKQ